MLKNVIEITGGLPILVWSFPFCADVSVREKLFHALREARSREFVELKNEFLGLLFKKQISDSRRSKAPEQLPELNPS